MAHWWVGITTVCFRHSKTNEFTISKYAFMICFKFISKSNPSLVILEICLFNVLSPFLIYHHVFRYGTVDCDDTPISRFSDQVDTAIQ